MESRRPFQSRDVRIEAFHASHPDFFPKRSIAICRSLAPRLRGSLGNGSRLQISDCYYRSKSTRKRHLLDRAVRNPVEFEKPHLFLGLSIAACDENPPPLVLGTADKDRNDAIDRAFG